MLLRIQYEPAETLCAQAHRAIQSVQEDNIALHSRMNNFEDKSRRLNLIFHGVAD